VTMALARFVFAGAVVARVGVCVASAAPAAGATAFVHQIAAPGPGSAAIRVYAPVDGDVPNPERGFFRQFTPFWLGTQRLPLDDLTLAAMRAEGLSVVRAYFVIDEFLTAPLSQTALDEIDAAFFAVRRAGLKIVPRFAYNFPTNADYQRARDAPLERVLGHIDQLTPVLIANADVIAFMEAGFVGAWGEWHSSANGLVEADRSLNSRSEAILARLLAALPRTRMVALRYPFHKQQLFGPVSDRSALRVRRHARRARRRAQRLLCGRANQRRHLLGAAAASPVDRGAEDVPRSRQPLRAAGGRVVRSRH